MVAGYGDWACLANAEYCSGWEDFLNGMAVDFH
jgi:hypothetical protein